MGISGMLGLPPERTKTPGLFPRLESGAGSPRVRTINPETWWGVLKLLVPHEVSKRKTNRRRFFHWPVGGGAGSPGMETKQGFPSVGVSWKKAADRAWRQFRSGKGKGWAVPTSGTPQRNPHGTVGCNNLRQWRVLLVRAGRPPSKIQPAQNILTERVTIF